MIDKTKLTNTTTKTNKKTTTRICRFVRSKFDFTAGFGNILKSS